jgi:hypothetical protein
MTVTLLWKCNKLIVTQHELLRYYRNAIKASHYYNACFYRFSLNLRMSIFKFSLHTNQAQKLAFFVLGVGNVFSSLKTFPGALHKINFTSLLKSHTPLWVRDSYVNNLLACKKLSRTYKQSHII